MFESHGNEGLQDVAHVQRMIEAYGARGFSTAINVEYAGMGLLRIGVRTYLSLMWH